MSIELAMRARRMLREEYGSEKRNVWVRAGSGMILSQWAKLRYAGDATYVHARTGAKLTVYVTRRAYFRLPFVVGSKRALLALRGVREAGTFKRW